MACPPFSLSNNDVGPDRFALLLCLENDRQDKSKRNLRGKEEGHTLSRELVLLFVKMLTEREVRERERESQEEYRCDSDKTLLFYINFISIKGHGDMVTVCAAPGALASCNALISLIIALASSPSVPTKSASLIQYSSA